MSHFLRNHSVKNPKNSKKCPTFCEIILWKTPRIQKNVTLFSKSLCKNPQDFNKMSHLFSKSLCRKPWEFKKRRLTPPLPLREKLPNVVFVNLVQMKLTLKVLLPRTKTKVKSCKTTSQTENSVCFLTTCTSENLEFFTLGTRNLLAKAL